MRRVVATMMVRDEADIIAAVIEHLVSQEIDLIIATDNGSVDGTTEVLQEYADAGVVELHHDPVHRKQQHAVVTGMARRAHDVHGADWVLNVDADEFWVPVDKTRTLRQVLESTPLSLNAFTVPVTNLVGPPARRGSGLDRLTWRDIRSDAELQGVGIYAQPTPNVVHRGDPGVVVAQGNHFVSLESNGRPDEADAIEVLHVPWRSWEQLRRKVESAGLGYLASPNLRPSKNHHGMADFRRLQAGRLYYAFLLRQPSAEELASGTSRGEFVKDLWLKDHLHGLAGQAVLAERLRAVLDSSDDDPIDPQEHRDGHELGRMFLELEREREESSAQADRRIKELMLDVDAATRQGRRRTRALRRAQKRLSRLQARPEVKIGSYVRHGARRSLKAVGAVLRRGGREGRT